MHRLLKGGAVAAVATTVAAVGAVVAYADWTIPGTMTVTMRTASMPSFHSGPAVQPDNRRVTVRWIALRMEKGAPVERYAVTRHGSDGTDDQVCVVETTQCRDTKVPDGSWTYTVRALHGKWSSEASPPSTVVVIGGETRRSAPAEEPEAAVAPPESRPASPAAVDETPAPLPTTPPPAAAATPEAEPSDAPTSDDTDLE